MDERARLAIGGSAVLATSAAVVLFVALSNAAALTDAPGAAIGQSAVLVPTPMPSTADADEASDTPAAVDPAIAVEAPPTAPADAPALDSPAPGAITVPAPEPVVVTPVAPETPGSVAPTAAEEEGFVAASIASGSWDAAIEWARAHGWTDEKVAAWIARLESRAASVDRSVGWRQAGLVSGGSVESAQLPAVEEWPPIDEVAPTVDDRLPGADERIPADVSSLVDEDPDSSETPASTGAPAVSGSDPDDGSKKDRSRESPDMRD